MYEVKQEDINYLTDLALAMMADQGDKDRSSAGRALTHILMERPRLIEEVRKRLAVRRLLGEAR